MSDRAGAAQPVSPVRVARLVRAGIAAGLALAFAWMVGLARFAALAADVTYEFARDVINGFAANVGEVENAVNRFRDILLEAGINVKFRQRKGDAINAACGQLRRSQPPLISIHQEPQHAGPS